MIDRIRLTAKLVQALPRLLRHQPGGKLTTGDRIEALADAHPDRPFVLFEDRTQTYGELDEAANRVAHWATGLALGPGDVVALLMENRPEYVATWAGLAKLGVITALINTNLTGRALRHALETANTRVLIVGSECLDRFATTANDLARPLQVWTVGDPDVGASGEAPSDARSLDADLAERPRTRPDPSVRSGLTSGDELFYIYTSGTTGLPKAARFSHLRFLGIGDLGAFVMPLGADDVHYCVLPLYHSAGGAMVVSAVLSAGCTLALRRKFSASRFWDDARQHHATAFQYIGELCRYLMNQPERPDDRDHGIRVAIGNGLRPDIWAGFQARFGIEDVREFYGATEGNTYFMNLENKVGSVGRYPFKLMHNARLVRFDVESETHIRDENGLCIECEPNEPGELLGKIATRGSQGRFEGYTSKEASDKKILRDVFEEGDAWFRTGDLLRHDEDDFFYFVDRIGDTFRWKGENVSTQEVAEVLSQHPSVEMANVYGVEVPGSEGRAGMAALVLESRDAFDPAAFHTYVRNELPGYAAPVFLRLLPDAEVTGTFKLRKVTYQAEGFAPEAGDDPIWFRDDAAGAFVPLATELVDELRAGKRKL